MNKKSLIFSLFAFCLIAVLFLANLNLIGVVSAEESTETSTSASSSFADPALNPFQYRDTFNNISAKWDYISKEWKNVILQNQIMKVVDSSFREFTLIFFVLFGLDYELSLEFFLVFIFWLYFLLTFNNIFKNYSAFSKGVSFGIAFLLTVFLAQIDLFEAMAKPVIWFFIGEKAWWVKLLIGVVGFLIAILVFGIIVKYGKQIKAGRKKAKDELNSIKMENQTKVMEPVVKAFKKLKE